MTQIATLLKAGTPLLRPLIVVLAIFVFRAPLGAALGRVTGVDGFGLKVSLQEQADDAANTTKAVGSKPTTSVARPCLVEPSNSRMSGM